MNRPTFFAGLFYLLLLWVITGSGCLVEKHHAETRQEPSMHSDSDSIHRKKSYQSIRFEGLSRSEAARRLVPYLRKYRNKRPDPFCRDTLCYQQFQSASGSPDIIADTTVKVSIAFLGDIMWTGTPHPSLLSPELQAFLSRHDLVVGNLETPLDTLRRVKSLLPDHMRYNSSGKLSDAFWDVAGNRNMLTLVSLANNHALDMGGAGLLRTFQVLEARNIAYVGACRKDSAGIDYQILERNGFRLGFCAATWGLNQLFARDTILVQVHRVGGIAPPGEGPLDISETREQLHRMEQEGVDLKIVLMHWGYEYEYYPDSLICRMAVELVQAGADLVIGHHPHVVQPFEVVYLNGYPGFGSDSSAPCPRRLTDPRGIPRKALICYSLGNFLSRMYTPACQTGVVVPVTIRRDPKTGRADWSLSPARKVNNKVPILPGKKHQVKLSLRD
ncbi:MAG TPA: CapA family protein [Bacteroidales bacterium]|nr:CapA family protein [Bacteroidales bacterium]HRZ50328.1 CapA family protein [Bacteroidales bacterium]